MSLFSARSKIMSVRQLELDIFVIAREINQTLEFLCFLDEEKINLYWAKFPCRDMLFFNKLEEAKEFLNSIYDRRNVKIFLIKDISLKEVYEDF